LNAFESLFDNIEFLIEKRQHKRLDFDSYQRKFKALKVASVAFFYDLKSA
jgi:hypothetical protein